MPSHQVAIIGANTYLGTALMRALTSMGVKVIGLSITDHALSHYRDTWDELKCPVLSNPEKLTNLSKVIITLDTDHLITHHQISSSHAVRSEKLIRECLNSINLPAQIYLFQPFDKHNLLRLYHQNTSLFGNRTDDSRHFQLIQHFARLSSTVRDKCKTDLTTIYIGDIFGPQMPLSPSHPLFWSISHQQLHESAQNLIEHYFPTHINDVIAGALKIIFGQSFDTEFTLVSEKPINVAQLNHQLNITQRRDWHLQLDYPIDYQKIKISQSNLTWQAKHPLNIKSIQARSKKLHFTPINEKTTPLKPTLHRKYLAPMLLISSLIVLSMVAIPTSLASYNIYQLQVALEQENTVEVNQRIENIENHHQNLYWLLTILKQRDHTENLLAVLNQQKAQNQKISTAQNLFKEGINILFAQLTANGDEQVINWQTAYRAVTEDVPRVYGSQTSQGKLSHLLNQYQKIQTQTESDIYTQNQQLAQTIQWLTSQANNGFLVTIKDDPNYQYYVVQHTPKGLVVSSGYQPLPTVIHLKASVLQGRNFSEYFQYLSLLRDDPDKQRDIYLHLKRAYQAGDIQIDKDFNNQKMLTISLNQEGKIDITQRNHSVTVRLSHDHQNQQPVTIKTSDYVSLQNIVDNYIRELNQVKVIAQNTETTMTYAPSHSSGDYVEITWQTQHQYSYVQLTQAGDHLYIPLK